MLNIHEKVNIIPIISKADMLTEKEKSRVKQQINDSIKEHGIKVSLKTINRNLATTYLDRKESSRTLNRSLPV